MHESIGTTPGRNINRVIGQHREFEAQLLFVNGAYRFYESIVLTVSGGRLLILFAVYLYFYDGNRVQSLCQSKRIVEQTYLLVFDVVFQYIGDDIRKILLRYLLFLIAQSNNPFGYFAHRFFVEFDAQSFEIFTDIGFSRSFSQCIFASATETLGKQVVVIEVAFAVSVGVHAGALCEYMFADDRLVGRNTHAGVGLDDPAYLIDFFLVDSGRTFELVVYHGQYARKRGISGTFT